MIWVSALLATLVEGNLLGWHLLLILRLVTGWLLIVALLWLLLILRLVASGLVDRLSRLARLNCTVVRRSIVRRGWSLAIWLAVSLLGSAA